MGKFTGTTVLTIMALRLPEFVQQVHRSRFMSPLC